MTASNLHDSSEPECPKCHGAGGTPIAWTDGNGRVHNDIAYCDCPAGQTRADRALNRYEDVYSDRYFGRGGAA